MGDYLWELKLNHSLWELELNHILQNSFGSNAKRRAGGLQTPSIMVSMFFPATSVYCVNQLAMRMFCNINAPPCRWVPSHQLKEHFFPSFPMMMSFLFKNNEKLDMEENSLYCQLITFSKSWGSLVQISAQMQAFSGLWTCVSPQFLGVLVVAPFNSFYWRCNSFVLKGLGDEKRK